MYTANNLVQGKVYCFKVHARNDYGYGAFGDVYCELAAQIPAKPQPPITSFAADFVTVDWTAPDNGGSPITSFTVYLRTVHELTFHVQTLYCDGSDSTIMADT
jgi:hypothetical protein